MEFLGAALGINLSLRGMSAVLGGLSNLRKDLGLTKSQLSQATTGLKYLSAELAFMGAALFKAGQDESMRLALQGATGDATLAARQIAFVRAESEKGLFDKDEIFKTVKLFDLAHESLSRFLPLTEEIAARSGKSLTETARYITELAGGGTARLMGLLKPAGITVEQLRGAGLNVSDHYQTKNSADQILAALEKITSANSVGGALKGGFLAAYKGDLASIVDLLRSVGDGLLPIATPVLQFLGGVIRSITFLNDLTHGWASNILLAVGAFMSIQKVIPLLTALAGLMKVNVAWATIWEALNGGWAKWPAMIWGAIKALVALISVERIAAAWEAIRAALQKNWAGLATAAGIAAAFGVAWYVSSKNQEESGKGTDPTPNGNRKPESHRSSFDNFFNRQMGHLAGR